MSYKVKVIRPEELSAAHTAAWEKLRAKNPALYSPYFHPDYTKLVGTLRDDAYVAIVTQNRKPVAFFPYQGPKPGKSGFATPIGSPMTDYHGFISDPKSSFDPHDVLRDAGIGAYYFNALVDPEKTLATPLSTQEIAAVIDVSHGGDAWREQRDKSYRRSIKSQRRRIRNAEEDFGPRRFDFDCKDPAIFEKLINWKKEKFRTTGKYDVLSADWTVNLLERLWTSKGDLRCEMHVLYFGGRTAAIDLGLTDGSTFHSWIVGYDPDLQTYSPGTQLLEAMIDAAKDLGYKRIDLGAGIDGYKRHYASEMIAVESGFVPVQGPVAALSRIYGKTEEIGKTAMKDIPGKFRRRYTQIAACDDTLLGRAKAMLQAMQLSRRS